MLVLPVSKQDILDAVATMDVLVQTKVLDVVVGVVLNDLGLGEQLRRGRKGTTGECH